MVVAGGKNTFMRNQCGWIGSVHIHIQDRIGYPQKCPKLLNLQRKPIYCVFADQIIFIPRWECGGGAEVMGHMRGYLVPL